MDTIFKEYLFAKHILVADTNPTGEHMTEGLGVLVALGRRWGIQIDEGSHLATKDMIAMTAHMLGDSVPLPFYHNFPMIVREMTKEQLIFDQIMHYAKTYGMGDWANEMDEPRSLFEIGDEKLTLKEALRKASFNEAVTEKHFRILREDDAWYEMACDVRKLLESPRPLSVTQKDLCIKALKTPVGINTFSLMVPMKCPCKDTAITMYIETRIMYFLKGLKLSDTIKMVDYIQFQKNGSENIRKLNLTNQQRKIIRKFIELCEESHRKDSVNSMMDIETCFEKRNDWCGLLHHIHYKPKYPAMAQFMQDIRSGKNHSAYSRFEGLMKDQYIAKAAADLNDAKGATALLRRADYILSRCENTDQAMDLMDEISLGAGNGQLTPTAAIQYMIHCEHMLYGQDEPRTFAFHRHNRMRVHRETASEQCRRKTKANDIPFSVRKVVRNDMRDIVRKTVHGLGDTGPLGKVWIDPKMKNIAVPIQMATSESGYGVLPTGSRVDIPEGKIIRAFTWWQKVNDIDLSCFGIETDPNGEVQEFSWRNRWNAMNGCSGVTFSGDVTNGYSGGSEYFDIDLEWFRRFFPKTRWLIFCDNIYSSGVNFSECEARAGFMMRENPGSGEIYEPKTVATSFQITAKGRFAYLFAIDLERRQMIWLNVSQNGNYAVAGDTVMQWLRRYFDLADIYSVYDLYSDAATQIVNDPKDANVIVGDDEIPGKLKQTEGMEWAHSWDTEKIMQLLNGAHA